MKLTSLLKSLFAILFIFLLTEDFYPNHCSAQTYEPRYYHHSDTIELYRTLNDFKYYRDGISLKPSEVSTMMEDYPAALRSFKKARSRQGWGKVLKFIGGALIGSSVLAYIGYRRPYWGIAGAGAAMFVVSFPIGNSSAKYALKAIQTYNQSVKNEEKPSVALDIGYKSPGFTLCLTF